jgi:hypothetical protein
MVIFREVTIFIDEKTSFMIWNQFFLLELSMRLFY